MADHMVILWLEGDTDPNDVDWEGKLATEYNDMQEVTRPGWEIKHKAIKSFPWSDVYHEINWWITRPMTIEEWSKLDDLESKALSQILGDDYMGTGGPIPGLLES